MQFSGISQEQLVAQLSAYELQLRDYVEFFECNVGWHGRAKLEAVKAELSAVVAFLGALVVKAAKVAQTATQRARCPHFKAIKRAFAIARDAGLNTRDDDAMRRAFGRSLGRTIESRECMSGGDWQAVGDAMKRGLTW